MLLVVIIAISLVVVAVAVAVDVLTDDTPARPKPPKNKGETAKRLADWRNRKKIESGLHMISKREVRVDRPRGSHRRLQAS